jgi:hypothetical protein
MTKGIDICKLTRNRRKKRPFEACYPFNYQAQIQTSPRHAPDLTDLEHRRPGGLPEQAAFRHIPRTFSWNDWQTLFLPAEGFRRKRFDFSGKKTYIK